MFGVVKALFFRELKTRFGANRLGYFWIILEPSLHLVIMLLLFSFVRGQMSSQFPFELFLLTGMLPYFLFKNITFFVMDGAKQNKNLFAYKPVKPIDVYISRTILETLIYMTIFVVFLFACGFFFDMPAVPINFVGVVGAIALIIFFGFALGLMLGMIIHIYPPARIFIQTVFKILYFISGVMYPLWILPQQYLDYLYYNPMIHLIDLVRRAFFLNYPQLAIINVYYPFCLSVVLLYCGLWVYYKKRFKLGTSI